MKTFLFDQELSRTYTLVALLVISCLCGCGVRTLMPIRYVPLLGAEKKVLTTDVLSHALQDRDPAVRAQAVALLGELAQSEDKGTQKAAAEALGIAMRDTEPGVRILVLEKLGALPPRLGNKYLLRALRDSNSFVREKVLAVLGAREAGPLGPHAQEPLRTATDQPLTE